MHDQCMSLMHCCFRRCWCYGSITSGLCTLCSLLYSKCRAHFCYIVSAQSIFVKLHRQLEFTSSRSLHLERIEIFLSFHLTTSQHRSICQIGRIMHQPHVSVQQGVLPIPTQQFILYSQKENNNLMFLEKRKFSLFSLIHCHGQKHIL